MTAEQIVAALVKPLVWVPYDPAGPFGQFGNGLFNYELREKAFGSFWWRRYGSGTWYQPEHDTSFEAAQSAAEADYRARIAAALDVDKLTALVDAGEGMVQAARTDDYALANKSIVALRDALAAFRGVP